MAKRQPDNHAARLLYELAVASAVPPVANRSSR